MSNASENPTAAGWDVELNAETVDRAEELLRDLATDAELEMAVLVEQSGGMIAGVATRQNVDVSTVGALVAGAFGAMGALARELGGSQVRESLHHGSGDTVYLREVAERFVLLGVAPGGLPSGLIREKGAQVAGKLTAMFAKSEDEPAADAEVVPAPAEEAHPVEASPEASPPPDAVAAEEPSPFQSAETGPVSPEPAEAAAPQSPGETVHTEISVEDEFEASPETAVPPGPGEADPDRDEPEGKPTYIFEIG